MNLNQPSELAKSTKKWFITVINHLHQLQYQKCQKNLGPSPHHNFLQALNAIQSFAARALYPVVPDSGLPVWRKAVSIFRWSSASHNSRQRQYSIFLRLFGNLPPTPTVPAHSRDRHASANHLDLPQKVKVTSNYLRESKIHNSRIRSTPVQMCCWYFGHIWAQWPIEAFHKLIDA